MLANKHTLAMYAIQDISDSAYPYLVHDHSLSVFKDGALTEHLHLERLTRIKYDNKLNEHLYSLLKQKKLLKNNFDVAFVDNVLGSSFISKEGNLRFEVNRKDEGISEKTDDGSLFWLDKTLKGYNVNHELAHIYSCVPFYGAFKENSLLVHFDGGASKGNYSVWIVQNNTLRLLKYGWGLKYLSSLFNANALVFALVGASIKEQNSVPGKFMGFASYGSNDVKILDWLRKNNFFENIWGKHKLFFNDFNKEFGTRLNSFDQRSNVLQNIAATIHHYFTSELVNFFTKLQEEHTADYLYYSGGSALNIDTNTKIVESGLFKDVFIPPCANDSGLSIGAGALLESQKGNTIKNVSVYANNWGIEDYKTVIRKDEIKKVANYIAKGEIIAICNGYGEVGPRALGNRSIIARADNGQLAAKLSMQCKGREWYRPVAPVMLEENAKMFTGKDKIHHLSKFMLLRFQVLPEFQKVMEGVVHVDGSARIQTIFNRSDNEFIYELLICLQEKHNIRALINTSFNGKGSPIVHTSDDALKAAREMGLDRLVVNGELIDL